MAQAVALELVLDDHALDEPQRQATLRLLAEVRQALAPSFVSRLDRSVSIAWDHRLPAEVIGRAGFDGRIRLNRRWLAPLTAGEGTELFQGRGHESLRTEMLATIIHELAHVYDRALLVSPAQRARLRHCSWQQQSIGRIGLPSTCRGNAERRFTFSDDPHLLDLAGWTERIGDRGGRAAQTDQPDRSPDAYEQASPAEFVAVNLEYFLLDPEYRCRRPALHDYFATHFGWAPASASCEEGFPFLHAGMSRAQPVVGDIDPARVYAVHYLLAEPNREWASRWGHSMLRLVICAPGKEPGAECLLDLEHHLVLSFRAFVDDLQLSSWDGLTGEYPSRLFILPLGQVVDEYTRLELRGLQSIPLKLSATQRAHLVRQAARLHWSYDGRYYFVSNNCAVETLRLLRIGTGDRRLSGRESITPAGVLQILKRQGLADPQPLRDRRAAMRAGYYFDSHRERQEQMLAVLGEDLGVKFSSVEQWLAQPAASRQALIGQAGQRGAAALLLLEQAAHDRHALLARQELLARYLAETGNPGLSKAGAAVQQLLNTSAFLSRPAELLDDGYGLPFGAERSALQRGVIARQRDWLALVQNLEDELGQLLSAKRSVELQGARENLELIGERLRLLHHQSGKMVLP